MTTRYRVECMFTTPYHMPGLDTDYTQTPSRFVYHDISITKLANVSLKTHRRDQLVSHYINQPSSLPSILANLALDRMDQRPPCCTVRTPVSAYRIVRPRWNTWH
jgi:hypothetical protein